MTVGTSMGAGWRVGSLVIREGLDRSAERSYVEMVGHFERCATCERAGAELARDPGSLYRDGRRRRRQWEESEWQCRTGRGAADA